MKNLRFLSLALALLALVFIFTGCSGGGTPASQNNAMLYTTVINNGKTAIGLVIADPSSVDRAAFAPKSGYLYVVLVENDNKGEEIKSAGEITMGTGGRITFTPTAGFTHSSFAGNLSGTSISLETVPGTTYTNVRVNERTGFNVNDADDLLDGGNIPNLPSSGGDDDGDDNSGGGGGGGGGGGSSNAPVAVISKAVKSIKIIEDPVFAPNVGSIGGTGTSTPCYLEGQEARLHSIKAEVIYDDGSVVTAGKDDFFISPPEYRTSSFSHTLKYKKGFALPSVSWTPIGESFALNSYWDINAVFKPLIAGPSSNVDPFKDLDYNTKTTGTRTLTTEAYEDQKLFSLSFSNLTIGKTLRGYYDFPAPPSTLSSHREKALILAYEGDLDTTAGTLVVQVGNYKNTTTPFALDEVYLITGIAINTKPSENNLRVLFDDKNIADTTSEPHWQNRLSGSSITVSYKGKNKGTPTTQTRSIAVTNTYKEPVIIPPTTTDLTNKPTVVITNDVTGGIGKEVYLPIEVYDRLIGIEARNKSGTIVMQGKRGNASFTPHTEYDFLKQITVAAIYQMGNDKTKTLKRDNILLPPDNDNYPSSSSGSDASYFLVKTLSGTPTLSTNVNDSGGILNKTNSDAYEGSKKKLAKAKVDFTTLGTMKSDTVDIGVTRYN
ncbi:MAG: hypothetical protein LBH07_02715 [Treponema sp.]|jgi:hypothetical protein|nr:hypothetical protein [Treponema sp.]